MWNAWRFITRYTRENWKYLYHRKPQYNIPSGIQKIDDCNAKAFSRRPLLLAYAHTHRRRTRVTACSQTNMHLQFKTHCPRFLWCLTYSLQEEMNDTCFYNYEGI